MRAKEKFFFSIRIIAILIITVCVMFPLYWGLTTSFKRPGDISAIPPQWFFQPSLFSWKTIFFEWGVMYFMKNSLIVSSIATFLTVGIGSLAAYAISRFKFYMRKGITFDILTLKMIPPIVTAIPLFLIAKQWGLHNTYSFLIMIYITFNLPFVVLVMKSFIDELPKELDEAALVDGCNRFQAFYKVILPLTAPGLFCCLILTYIFCWNEFLFANIFTMGKHRTLPIAVALSFKQRAVAWGPAAAVSIFVIIPIVILSLVVSKHIVRGMTLGAMK